MTTSFHLKFMSITLVSAVPGHTTMCPQLSSHHARQEVRLCSAPRTDRAQREQWVHTRGQQVTRASRPVGPVGGGGVENLPTGCLGERDRRLEPPKTLQVVQEGWSALVTPQAQGLHGQLRPSALAWGGAPGMG